jgi:hypothetical protein
MRKSSKKSSGSSGAVKTTMKPVFGKRVIGKRGGRGR